MGFWILFSRWPYIYLPSLNPKFVFWVLGGTLEPETRNQQPHERIFEPLRGHSSEIPNLETKETQDPTLKTQNTKHKT